MKRLSENSHFNTPFIEYCESVKRNEYQKNVIQLINLQTSAGKTHSTFNFGIPTLFDSYDVDLICYVYPYIEIYDNNTVESAILLSNNAVHIKLEETNMSEISHKIVKYIQNGKKVLLTSTFNSFFAHTENYGNELIKVCKTNCITSALFVDEIHQWSTSDYTHYNYNTGNSNKTFNSTAYKCMSNWSKNTPYVFGLTATLTNEMITNRVKGSTTYNVLVDHVPVEKLIHTSAWLDKFTYYNHYDKTKTWVTFKQFIYDFETTNRKVNLLQSKYRYKKNDYFATSMLIRVSDIRGDYDTHSVLRCINARLSWGLRYDSHKYTEFCIGVMDQYGCYLYNINGDCKKVDETVIKNRLNQYWDPLRYLIVVNRGKSGININTLKWYFDFRTSKSKNSEGDYILPNYKQLLGRLQRLNPPLSYINWFIEEYGYNIQPFISNCKKYDWSDKLDQLFVTNSYRVCVPNLQIWREIESAIVNEISNTLDTVKSIIAKP